LDFSSFYWLFAQAAWVGVGIGLSICNHFLSGDYAMKKKYLIPRPKSIRRIQHSFAWIDHLLIRDGYLQVMTHEDLVLYVFLILAADCNGVSFYRKEKICDALSLSFNQFEIARDRLLDMKLIAFEPYSVLTPNGFYQVLPITGQAPDYARQVFQRDAQQS
jgi:hypothetical protein